MSYKSNIYCCVPGCTQKGTVDPEGNRVGFFGFPKDQNRRQEWLVKIRRDIGPHFKLTEATKEGVIALTAKIKVALVASAFYVLEILVFKERFSLLPAGWDRMMTASQPLSAILDIFVHLCLRK